MYNKYHYSKLILSLCFILTPLTAANATQSYKQIIDEAKLTEVSDIIKLKHDETILQNLNGIKLSYKEKQAGILLTQLGCLKSHTPSQLPPPVSECVALKPLSISYPKIPTHVESLLNKLLAKGVFEGYNIKNQALMTSPKSGENVILYGHSSLLHAKQLITLLTINDIDFTWKLIAKNSAFNIRNDWQDTQPNEQGSSIRKAKEYDIQFTFGDQIEQQLFMSLINQYAKKNNDNQTGLIIDAWWQPFYRTFYQNASYRAVKRISLQADGYNASTLVLASNLNKVLTQIKSALLEEKMKVVVSSENIWVNPAFYRYLNGDYK